MLNDNEVLHATVTCTKLLRIRITKSTSRDKITYVATPILLHRTEPGSIFLQTALTRTREMEFHLCVPVDVKNTDVKIKK